jgi:hypothetical protein
MFLEPLQYLLGAFSGSLVGFTLGLPSSWQSSAF